MPVAVCHGFEWFDHQDMEAPVNGPFTKRHWKMSDQYALRDYTLGCDQNHELKPFDFFMAVFPKKQLLLMVDKTSLKL